MLVSSSDDLETTIASLEEMIKDPLTVDAALCVVVERTLAVLHLLAAEGAG